MYGLESQLVIYSDPLIMWKGLIGERVWGELWANVVPTLGRSDYRASTTCLSTLRSQAWDKLPPGPLRSFL